MSLEIQTPSVVKLRSEGVKKMNQMDPSTSTRPAGLQVVKHKAESLTSRNNNSRVPTVLEQLCSARLL